MYRQDCVYAKRPFGGAEQVFRYLGRYSHRVAIANSRLLTLAAGQVSFRWKDYADEHRTKVMSAPRTRTGALLQGLLRCVACDCAMTPSHASKRGHRRYCYYVCTQAQKRGRNTCPAPSLPAAEIERFVVDQLRNGYEL